MANTYYNSQLSAEEIESALEAVKGVIVPANNGKVLYINNGKIAAKSVVPGGAVLESLSVTQNGDYYPGTGVDGYNEVHVNVSGGITPTGTINISQNGIYDVTNYANANVNVSGGGDDPFVGLNDYIQSSGTQWINTGYSPNLNTKIIAVLNLEGVNSKDFSVIFGAEGQSSMVIVFDKFGGQYLPSSNRVGIFYAIGGNTRAFSEQWSPNSGQWYTDMNAKFFNRKIAIEAEMNNHILVQNTNGEIIQTPVSVQSNPIGYPLWIFDNNERGSHNSALGYCRAKLYSFQIFENSTLIMELLPHQENGVVCLRDTVSGNLFYNQGTGTFTYGTDT